MLEEMERVTRSKVIKLYKVVWNNQVNKMPCGNERITYMRFIPLLSKNGRSCKSQNKIFIRERGFNTLVVRLA